MILFKSKDIQVVESSLDSNIFSIALEDLLYHLDNIHFLSDSKQENTTLPPSWYIFLFIQDKSHDNHAKGRIKYEMQAFIRVANRFRAIKTKSEVTLR